MSTQGRSRSPTPTSSEPGTPPQHRPATSPRVGPPSQGDSLGAPTPHERRELVVSLDRLAPHSYPGRRRVGSDDRGMGDQFHDAVTGQVDSATQCPHPSRSPPPVDARAVTTGVSSGVMPSAVAGLVGLFTGRQTRSQTRSSSRSGAESGTDDTQLKTTVRRGRGRPRGRPAQGSSSRESDEHIENENSSYVGTAPEGGDAEGGFTWSGSAPRSVSHRGSPPLHASPRGPPLNRNHSAGTALVSRPDAGGSPHPENTLRDVGFRNSPTPHVYHGEPPVCNWNASGTATVGNVGGEGSLCSGSNPRGDRGGYSPPGQTGHSEPPAVQRPPNRSVSFAPSPIRSDQMSPDLHGAPLEWHHSPSRRDVRSLVPQPPPTGFLGPTSYPPPPGNRPAHLPPSFELSHRESVPPRGPRVGLRSASPTCLPPPIHPPNDLRQMSFVLGADVRSYPPENDNGSAYANQLRPRDELYRQREIALEYKHAREHVGELELILSSLIGRRIDRAGSLGDEALQAYRLQLKQEIESAVFSQAPTSLEWGNVSSAVEQNLRRPLSTLQTVREPPPVSSNVMRTNEYYNGNTDNGSVRRTGRGYDAAGDPRCMTAWAREHQPSPAEVFRNDNTMRPPLCVERNNGNVPAYVVVGERPRTPSYPDRYTMREGRGQSGSVVGDLVHQQPNVYDLSQVYYPQDAALEPHLHPNGARLAIADGVNEHVVGSRGETGAPWGSYRDNTVLSVGDEVLKERADRRAYVPPGRTLRLPPLPDPCHDRRSASSPMHSSAAPVVSKAVDIYDAYGYVGGRSDTPPAADPLGRSPLPRQAAGLAGEYAANYYSDYCPSDYPVDPKKVVSRARDQVFHPLQVGDYRDRPRKTPELGLGRSVGYENHCEPPPRRATPRRENDEGGTSNISAKYVDLYGHKDQSYDGPSRRDPYSGGDFRHRDPYERQESRSVCYDDDPRPRKITPPSPHHYTEREVGVKFTAPLASSFPKYDNVSGYPRSGHSHTEYNKYDYVESGDELDACDVGMYKVPASGPRYRVNGNDSRSFDYPPHYTRDDGRRLQSASFKGNSPSRPHSQPANRYAKPIRPDRYDGSSDLETYLVHFQLCAQHNGWDEDECTEQLQLSLRGKAVAALKGATGQPLRFTQIVERLKRRYGVKGQEVRCRNELKARRRKPGESLLDLADDIDRLLAGAYPDMDVSILGLEYFLGALGEGDFVTRVRDKCPRNLEHAISIAIQFESYSDVSTSRSRNDNNNSSRVRGALTDNVNADAVNVQPSTLGRPPCGNCGKNSHPTVKCWAKGGANEAQAPYRQREQRLTQTVVQSPVMGEVASSPAINAPTPVAVPPLMSVPMAPSQYQQAPGPPYYDSYMGEAYAGQGLNPYRPPRDYSRTTCYNCQQLGHLSRVCPWPRAPVMGPAVPCASMSAPSGWAGSGDARVGAVYCASCTAIASLGHEVCRASNDE